MAVPEDDDTQHLLQLDLALTQSRLKHVLATLAEQRHSPELFEEGLSAAHTLKALAAVQGIAHLEQFSAQLEQFFIKARHLTDHNASDIRHLLTPIAREFNQACRLAEEIARKEPAFKPSEKLRKLVETVRTLEQAQQEKRYLDALAQAPTGEVLLESLFRSFLPWIQRAALETEKQIQAEILVSSPIYLPRTAMAPLQTILVHLLRNAVFHGIESPAMRQQLGKPEAGTLEINVECHEDTLVIAVSDDGKGFSKVSGVQAVITPDLPKFPPETADSESTTVGETSIYAVSNHQTGLGIGLHIVKTQVEQLQGSLEIKSLPRVGTCVVCSLPFAALVTAAPHD